MTSFLRNLPLFLLFISCNDFQPPEFKTDQKVPVQHTTSNRTSYEGLKERIDSTRRSLRSSLKHAKQGEQDTIFRKADSLLHRAILHDLYEYWRGTPWDFNGITQTPQQGSIACGYFVTTLLKHTGHPLNRVQLATCASMEMIKKLTSTADIKNLSSLSFEDFTRTIRAHINAVYVIGLDYHTGFIATDENNA